MTLQPLTECHKVFSLKLKTIENAGKHIIPLKQHFKISRGGDLTLCNFVLDAHTLKRVEGLPDKTQK